MALGKHSSRFCVGIFGGFEKIGLFFGEAGGYRSGLKEAPWCQHIERGQLLTHDISTRNLKVKAGTGGLIFLPSHLF